MEEEEEDLLAYSQALEQGPLSPPALDDAASVVGEAGKSHSLLVYRLRQIVVMQTVPPQVAKEASYLIVHGGASRLLRCQAMGIVLERLDDREGHGLNGPEEDLEAFAQPV